MSEASRPRCVKRMLVRSRRSPTAARNSAVSSRSGLRRSRRMACRHHRPHPGPQDHQGRRPASMALERMAPVPPTHPRTFVPAATGGRRSFTPVGAVCAIAWRGTVIACEPGRVTGRGMRPRDVAAGAPDGDRMRAWARLQNSVSFRSTSHILPLKPSSETFHEAMSRVGLPGSVLRHSTPWPAHRFMVSPDVGSVPLFRKVIRGIAFRSSPIRHDHPGLPRRSISAASSRATHRPEMDVSGIAARHPRVTSSTRFSIRDRRPQASRP